MIDSINHMNKVQKDFVMVGGHPRSGTSILTKLLREMGVFLGGICDPRNVEHGVVCYVNQWILLVHNRWELDVPEDDMRTRIKPAREFIDINIPNVHNWDGYVSGPWAAKSPATALTACIWKEMYPNIKFINIVRNGLDVTASWINYNPGIGADDQVELLKKNDEVMIELYRHRMGVYKQYVARGRLFGERYPKDYFEVNYEELVTFPHMVCDRIRHFLKIGRNDGKLEEYIDKTISEKRIRNIYDQIKDLEAYQQIIVGG